MSGQFHDFALDGFAFTGTDEFGCQWTVANPLRGWFTFDGQVRTSVEPRSQQPGSFRGPSTRGGRIVTVTGRVRAPSTSALEYAGRRLSSLLARGEFGEFVGASDAGTFATVVQLDDAPTFEPITDVIADYTVVLGSEDPLLYGPAWFGSTTMAGTSAGAGFQWPLSWPWNWGVPAGVTPGSLFVPNAGLAPYWAKLRIDGPVPNPVVGCVETGDTIRWGATIPAGQWVDIDTGERHVTFGANQDDVRYLTQAAGQWLVIPPGGATFTFDGDTADPAAKLSVFAYEGAWD